MLVVIWILVGSIVVFAFPRQQKIAVQRSEIQTAFRRFNRDFMLLKVIILAMLGTLLAILIAFSARLLSYKTAMILVGTDLMLLAVVLLGALRPWNWTFYSALAKRN